MIIELDSKKIYSAVDVVFKAFRAELLGMDTEEEITALTDITEANLKGMKLLVPQYDSYFDGYIKLINRYSDQAKQMIL